MQRKPRNDAEKLVGARYTGKNIEYREKEFIDAKGKKKRERNIPKKFVDAFMREIDEPMANTKKIPS